MNIWLRKRKSTLISAKNNRWRIVQGAILIAGEQTGDDKSRRYDYIPELTENTGTDRIRHLHAIKD